MQGAKGEAVLIVLRTLCNEADAAGSARPMGKNARFLFLLFFLKPMIWLCYRMEAGVFMNSPGKEFYPLFLVVNREIVSSGQRLSCIKILEEKTD